MQWSRVKTILIVTLLAANLFMAVSNFTLSYGRNYLSKKEIAGACEALSGMKLTVQPEEVLRKKPLLPVVVVKSDYEPILGFARELIGNTYTSDQSLTLSSPAGSFQIYAASFPVEFVFTSGEQAPQAKSPVSFVKNFFTAVSQSGNYRIESSNETGGRTVVTVIQTINHTDIRGCGVVFTFENKTLNAMSGKWIFTENAVSTKRKLPDSVNALFSIAQSNDPILPDNITVTAMRLVYYPFESPALKNVSLNPSLLLTFEGGSTFLFDLTSENLLFDSSLPMNVA